jgi:hypothetical protein
VDIQVQSFLNSGTKLAVTVTNTTTVVQLKTLVYGIEGVTTTVMAFYFDDLELSSTATMASYSIVNGSFISSSNTIANLPTKEARQIAKLDLAQLRRRAAGVTTSTFYRQYNTYDRSLLPSKYIGNTSTDNVSVTTPVAHRPWV